ncbi:MAG: thermonuclease family protein [Euryarchaeota archaeon]|nr:thermonuclease family protein [Euryarchaeota archaeon]
MKKEIISILVLLALLLPSFASATSIEAFGTVTDVIDGDTIDVRIEGQDYRIYEDIIRVRLADIDTPEMDTPTGPIAKQFTYQELNGNTVYLDLDNKTGKDPYDRWIAVVYLLKPDGTLENFNRMLVDSGQACIWDFDDNEFDPATWWNGYIPADTCIKSSDSDLPQSTVGSIPGLTSSGSAAKISTGSQDYISQETSSSNSQKVSSNNGPFVGSAKSDKYHYPSCSAAKKIKSSNLVTFSSSAEARGAGYVPCKICHPP